MYRYYISFKQDYQTVVYRTKLQTLHSRKSSSYISFKQDYQPVLDIEGVQEPFGSHYLMKSP